MIPKILYQVNPDRNVPWNDLPPLPARKELYLTVEVLVKFVFTQPLAKVKHFVDAGIYAENTARDYLNRLCNLKILEKKEIEDHHYYLNIELYRILTE